MSRSATPQDGRMLADAHADRMAFALRAFAEPNRDAVGETRERFQVLDGAVQLRTLVRMTDDDYFWISVDPALATRFQALLNTPITVGQWNPSPPEVASWLALAGSTYARGRLPGLTVRFDNLSDSHRQQVIAARPGEFFLPKVIDMLRTAGSWRISVNHRKSGGYALAASELGNIRAQAGGTDW